MGSRSTRSASPASASRTGAPSSRSTPSTPSTPFPEDLGDLSLVVPDLADLDSSARVTVEYARRHLGAELVGLARHDPAGAVLLGLTSPDVGPLYDARCAPTPWTATAGRTTVRILDTHTDTTFPAFSRRLAAHGVRSFRSLTMPRLRTHAVSLDLFSREAGDLADCSEQARVVLCLLGAAMQSFDRAENLAAALRSREVIGQAQGIVMERFDVDGGRALEVLRRWSQESQVKVRDLAAQLVEHRGRPAVWSEVPTDAEDGPEAHP